MEYHGNPVVFGHQPHVLSSGDGAQDCGLLFVVFDAFTSHEGTSTVAELL